MHPQVKALLGIWGVPISPHYGKIGIYAEKSARCPVCNTRRHRREHIYGFCSQYNLNALGEPKTRKEVQEDSHARADEWGTEPFKCSKCGSTLTPKPKNFYLYKQYTPEAHANYSHLVKLIFHKRYETVSAARSQMGWYRNNSKHEMDMWITFGPDPRVIDGKLVELDSTS